MQASFGHGGLAGPQLCALLRLSSVEHSSSVEHLRCLKYNLSNFSRAVCHHARFCGRRGGGGGARLSSSYCFCLSCFPGMCTMLLSHTSCLPFRVGWLEDSGFADVASGHMNEDGLRTDCKAAPGTAPDSDRIRSSEDGAARSWTLFQCLFPHRKVPRMVYFSMLPVSYPVPALLCMLARKNQESEAFAHRHAPPSSCLGRLGSRSTLWLAV